MVQAPVKIEKVRETVVRLVLTSGRMVRAVNWTPADTELAAGWEVSLGIDVDGQHRMTWIADSAVADVIVENA